MRYYDLKIFDPDSGKVWKPNAKSNGFTKSAGGTTFSSHNGNTLIPGALNIEFDIPTAPFNTPQGAVIIHLSGVGLGMIGQAADLAGQSVRLAAGMKKGLPLATAAAPFAGTILDGTIYQAFGNWQGTEQTLDLICNPPAARAGQDISFYWPAGMSLETALATAFQQAFVPQGMSFELSIASLISNSDGSGHYESLAALADYVLGISQLLGQAAYGDDYLGVRIVIIGNKVFAYDSQHTLKPITLAFRDLIGQPTWIQPGTINLKTVMRSDITNSSRIKLPEKGLAIPYVLTTEAAAVPNSPARNKSVFQGEFVVVEVHHFGNFRQSDANAWCTTINAVPVNAA